MNGLEAYNELKKMITIPNHKDYEEIRKKKDKLEEVVENDLKVLNILKEKKVYLWFIYEFVDKFSTLETFVEYYEHINGWKGYHLTLEEMTTIVNWLKGE